MIDTIYREDAIKAVVSLLRCEKYSPSSCVQFEEILVDVLNAIGDIPSADRPQGESILQDTIRRLEKVIKHGVAGKDGMHPVSAEVVLNWLKGADDEPER